MSGLNIDPGAMQDPRVKGLFQKLLLTDGGEEQPAQDPDAVTPGRNNMPTPAISPNRISDDMTKHPEGQDFVDQAPGMAQAGRASLADAVRAQNQQPAHLAQLESEYNQLGQPIKHSLRQKIGMFLAGAAGGPGPVERAHEFEVGQQSSQRARLLQEIEAERRMQEQENTANERMTLQERMQSERERAAEEAQGRLFGQQNELEKTRETARHQQETERENAANTRQENLFHQQQTLADQREDAAERRQQAMFRQQQTLLNQRESNQKATADETRRSDLARNMSENLDQLEEIAKRRPDLFGPVAGRWTQLKTKIGTSDPDVARLNAIHEYLGMASVGAHAMRNAQHVAAAADAVMAGFTNSPAATLAAAQEARNSIATFQQDAGDQPGSAPRRGAQGGAKQGGAKLKDRVGGKVLVEGKDF